MDNEVLNININKNEKLMILFFLDLIKDEVDKSIQNKIELNYKEIIKQGKSEYYIVVIKFMFQHNIRPLWDNDLHNILNNLPKDLDL